uniref:L1 transposable element RRM domain-containing protein n=1 Tax=Latimeria chalumnae TaxID=7897 RepID=H3A4U0_LATCH
MKKKVKKGDKIKGRHYTETNTQEGEKRKQREENQKKTAPVLNRLHGRWEAELNIGIMLVENIYVLLQKLAQDITDLRSTVEKLQATSNVLTQRVADAEKRISEVEDASTSHDQQQLKAATDKINNLENRSRQNNLRILGFPEGIEKGNLCAFLSEVLPEVLKLPTEVAIEMERAHRSLGPKPSSGQRPRAFIVKILCFPIKEQILKVAKSLGEMEWQGHRISIFLDLSGDLQLRRQKFAPVRKILRDNQFKYGLFYPAALKITDNGETHSFTNPEAAQKCISS